MTSADGRKRKWARLAAFVAGVTAIAVPAGYAGGAAYTRVDSEWYLYIAQGNTKASMHPFAARQLGPLVVRALAAVTHASLLHCFLLLGIVSLLTTAAICGWLLIRQGAGWLELLAVGGTFFWSATFGSFMLPDTFAAALLAIFLALLWKRKYTWAICMLLPMFVGRESTVLVLICLLIAGWRFLSWLQRGLSVLLSATGMFIVHQLTAHSLPNHEQINPLLYMAGKMPWNFVSNVLAMGPWMSAFTGFCSTPWWSFQLPAGMQLGGSHFIGVCGWTPMWHARLLLIPLCSFGLLPLLTLFLARYHRRLFWGDDLFRRFCVIYGVVTFAMAPLLGRSMERLFLYSWPLFLLITPVLVSRAFRNKNVPWKLLLVLHLATAWMDFLLFAYWDQDRPLHAWGLCAVVVAVNVLAWQLLRRAELTSVGSADVLESV
jgi:hypothetical protein